MSERLMALFKANKGRGQALSHSAEGDVTHIYLYDVIGWPFIEAQDVVNTLSNVKTDNIVLHINSPGGDVFEGVAIMNALKAHDAKITARIDGLAASAASFIMLAADEIEMGEATQIMIHNAWGFTMGNRHDHESQAVTLGQIDGDMAKMYAAKAGGEISDWASRMDAETFYTREGAIAIGLADRETAEKPKAEITFDLSAFKAPPKSEVQDITVKPTVDFSEFNAELDKAEARVDGFLAKLGKALGMGGTTKEPVEPTIDPPAPAFIEGSRAALLSRLKPT